MNKFDRIMFKYRWVFAPLLYLAICVWMFCTATVTIEGVQVDQVTAGTYALITWHAILLFALGAAWVLNKIVNWISNIKRKR